MNFRELEGACYVDPICISIRVFLPESHLFLQSAALRKQIPMWQQPFARSLCCCFRGSWYLLWDRSQQ